MKLIFLLRNRQAFFASSSQERQGNRPVLKGKLRRRRCFQTGESLPQELGLLGCPSEGPLGVRGVSLVTCLRAALGRGSTHTACVQRTAPVHEDWGSPCGGPHTQASHFTDGETEAGFCRSEILCQPCSPRASRVSPGAQRQGRSCPLPAGSFHGSAHGRFGR